MNVDPAKLEAFMGKMIGLMTVNKRSRHRTFSATASVPDCQSPITRFAGKYARRDSERFRYNRPQSDRRGGHGKIPVTGHHPL
jgi:hypothetical protein